MAAVIEVTKLKIDRAGFQRVPVTIPVSRIDEIREVMINDLERGGEKRAASELVKVSGEVILLDEPKSWVTGRLRIA